MAQNHNKAASQLAEAIVALTENNTTKATALVAGALRTLTGSVVSSTETVTTSAPEKRKYTRKVKNANRRGPRPALDTEQVARMKERIAAGDSIGRVAKQFGVSYPTAHNYLRGITTPRPVSTTSVAPTTITVK